MSWYAPLFGPDGWIGLLLRGAVVTVALSVTTVPFGFGAGLVLALIAGALSVALMWWGGERLFSTFGVEAALVPLSARVMNVLALSIPLHLLYIAGTYFLEAIKKIDISPLSPRLTPRTPRCAIFAKRQRV
jgi:Na+-driven multidrug efflux pump